MPPYYHTGRSTLPRAALRVIAIAALSSAAAVFTACRPSPPDLAALAASSRTLLELETCEYVYHDIVYQSRLEKLLGLVTTKDVRLLFSVDIRVAAGLDLIEGQAPRLRLEPDNAAASEATLIVELPPARIIRIDADEASIRQYFLQDYDVSGKPGIRWLDAQAEIGRAKERARADATRRGLERQAWDNAAQTVSGFFRLAGFREVKVVLREENS